MIDENGKSSEYVEKVSEWASKSDTADLKSGKIPLPEIDFSTFIFSLNSSALVQLGVLNDPISGAKSANFILAKHTIDTISMLKEKTEGNLNSEELELISGILYNLRMLYVKIKGLE